MPSSIIEKYPLVRNKPLGLAFVVLVLNIALALVTTVWSLYLDSFLHNIALVGLVSALLTGISVFWLFFSTPIIERFPESRVFVYSLFGMMVSYCVFFFTTSFAVFIIVALLMVITDVLRLESFGIMYRDIFKLSEMGKAHGLQFTFSNIGWLVGPLFAGYLSGLLEIRHVFLAATLFCAAGLLLFKTLKIRSIDHKTLDDGTIRGTFRNIREFFMNKELFKNYIVSGGISAFWGILYVYIPLFIRNAGLSYSWVGIFLAAIVLPLIFFEYLVGKAADKKGCRMFFILGYGIMALFSFAAFFASSIYCIMALFVAASIGASFLEGTTEAFFFKIVRKSEEEKFYGPFKSCKFIFNTLSKAAGAGIVFILPQNYIFLMLAVEMLFFMAFASLVNEKMKKL